MATTLKIALAGNPNSGKTSLFNVLTGLNQKVGNFPGVTVDRKFGTLRLRGDLRATLVDLPGTYSLYPASLDEEIASEILRDAQHPDHPDQVIYVADATNLRRSLQLCTQIMDLGIPVLLAINMADLADKAKFKIDVRGLEAHLGIPVVSLSALKKTGIETLKNRIQENRPPAPQPVFRIPESFVAPLAEFARKNDLRGNYTAWQALLKPELYPGIAGDQVQELREKIFPQGDPAKTADSLLANEITVRFDYLSELMAEVEARAETPGARFSARLDNVLLHGAWGYLGFVLLLLLIFQAVFAWAKYPMDWIDAGFAEGGTWMEAHLPQHFLSDLFINGIWAGLGGIIIFVPQIALLFMFIAILEDSGYMSRVVFLMDRLMRPFGFSGKSIIPLIGGMACAVPSIMMARTIPNRTERLITILVTPLMSCSARIPVYTLLIGMFVPDQMVLGFLNLQGLVMLGMYFLGFAAALAVAWVLKKMLKYGSDAIFFTEMPIFRMPRWKNVALTMFNKSKTFVLETGKIILVISIALWFLANYAPGDSFQKIDDKYTLLKSDPNLSEEELAELDLRHDSEKLKTSYAGRMGSLLEPVIRPLGFDWKIGISLVTSFAAREVFVGTMATIYSVGDGDDAKGIRSLRQRMLAEKDPETGQPVYTLAVALSLLVFYAFAMQCMSTLAVAKRETGSWKWTGFMLVYMTGLAYLASLAVFQLMSV
ncbi:MAG: ferrous iron transport protein B [Bacteroidia bacterium]|nr:ferrous iron transport protein B [Bacteroidia bacterium]